MIVFFFLFFLLVQQGIFIYTYFGRFEGREKDKYAFERQHRLLQSENKQAKKQASELCFKGEHSLKSNLILDNYSKKFNYIVYIYKRLIM